MYRYLLATAITLGFLLYLSSASATPIYLVRDGTPQGVILISKNAPESVQFAAKELQDHAFKITGASLPIETERPKLDVGSRVAVSLGATAFAESHNVTSKGLAPDGFRIGSAGGAVVIVGKDHVGPPLGDRGGRLTDTYNKALGINAHGETGTLFGVYRLLHDQGVRWYMPGEIGSVIPTRADIKFDGIPIEDAPYYEYRRLWGFSFNKDPDAAVWYKRVGYGSVRYVNLNHSFTNWVDRFGKTNPEYFASIDGRRHSEVVRDKQRAILNFTEAGVLEQVVTDAERYFSKNPGEPLFPVVPNDSHIAHDESPETLKYINKPKYSKGWLSDLVWTFVNKVAEQVREEYPDKQVGSLAYSYQFDAPTSIERFSPNVVVMHCRRRLNFWNKSYKQYVWKNLEAYTALRPYRQYVWEYYNFRGRGKGFEWIPTVAPRLIASDIKDLKGYSSGEFIQIEGPTSSKKLPKIGYSHLNLYVTARALWNPDIDVENLLDEYYRLFYGPASGPMSHFWNRLEELWTQREFVGEFGKPNPPGSTKHQKRRWATSLWSQVFHKQAVEELFTALDEATELAQNHPEYLRRVSFIRSEFAPMQENAMEVAPKP